MVLLALHANMEDDDRPWIIRTQLWAKERLAREWRWVSALVGFLLFLTSLVIFAAPDHVYHWYFDDGAAPGKSARGTLTHFLMWVAASFMCGLGVGALFDPENKGLARALLVMMTALVLGPGASACSGRYHSLHPRAVVATEAVGVCLWVLLMVANHWFLQGCLFAPGEGAAPEDRYDSEYYRTIART
uniref:Uncharacterized protein n=2 Tax=Lotharella globosa TaxID=91324 RepID=A0A7S4DMJ4_9EUKA|mmetsp:Transcript_14962/g.28302  ORF Transcript_14962/g.28302 Transcript_14962/m.28302 type:complete len:188 (+) Transcript_14962:148-711(+)